MRLESIRTDPVDGSLLVPWALALALMLIGAWSLARFVTDRL
ncbi:MULTISPECIES: hypothetical protein [unclassified Blastococcus]